MKIEAFLDRPLPSSDEAERAILGSILLDNQLAGDAAESLTPDDFYSPLNRKIFTAMLTLLAASKRIDPILIAEELKKEGPIDVFGGVATITNLSFGLPHYTDISPYISAVRDKATARELIKLCSTISDEAVAETHPIATVIDRAEQAIFNLSSNKDGAETLKHIALASFELLTEKKYQFENNIDPTGFRTGLKDLDRKLGGFKRGDLVIVAARPSMGKTALATQILFDGATEAGGEVVLFFSCEMSTPQVAARVICQQADANLWSFTNNGISPSEFNRIGLVTKPFQHRNFLIDDRPAVTPMQMLSRARRVKARYKRLDAIGIDYLQLMNGNKRGNGNRQQEVSDISRDLKGIARTLNLPVIALSQLSRAPEGRATPKPMMSDLRESGAIEQDADTVLFIFREEYYEKDEEKKKAIAGKAEIIIGKQRNGPTDTVEVDWKKQYAKFLTKEFGGFS